MNKTYGESIGLTAAIAGTLLFAGCATSEAPAPTSTFSAEASPATPELIVPKDTMDVQYFNEPGTDDRLSTMQKQIGIVSVEAVLMEPFTVMVDGESLTVSVSIPEDPTAQSQLLVFLPDSKSAGEYLTKNGIEDQSTTNVTQYSLAYGADGGLVRSGSSVSVVGQEYTNVGPFHAIATERCQPLDMIGDTPITDPVVYDGVKEAICNTLGFAADTIMLQGDYQSYVSTHRGESLGDDVNNGHDIKYPVLSKLQFDHLSKINR